MLVFIWRLRDMVLVCLVWAAFSASVHNLSFCYRISALEMFESLNTEHIHTPVTLFHRYDEYDNEVTRFTTHDTRFMATAIYDTSQSTMDGWMG